MDVRILLGNGNPAFTGLQRPAGNSSSSSTKPTGVSAATLTNPNIGINTSTGASTGISAGNSLPSFGNVLRQFIAPPTATGLTISAHAQRRLQERQITMTNELCCDLALAINELQAKGGRESLIIRGDNAFVVNVPTRTLITAMGNQDMQDKIITQIDSVSIKMPTQEATT